MLVNAVPGYWSLEAFASSAGNFFWSLNVASIHTAFERRAMLCAGFAFAVNVSRIAFFSHKADHKQVNTVVLCVPKCVPTSKY